MDFRSIQLRAAGFELHADLWEGGTLAHVLLLHGLGGNSITWHGVAPTLARALKARVLAIDLPGFGATRPGPRRVGLDALCQVVESVLCREAGVRWHVAGNSLGGVLALRVACQVPAKVERVTLAAVALPLTWGRSLAEVAALGGYVPAAVPWFGRWLVSRHVRRTGVPGVVDGPVRQLFADPALLDPELRQRLIAVSEHRLTWADEAARALEQTSLSLGVALLHGGRANHWIQSTRCPVRAIYGGRDPLYPERAWERLQRMRPDWQHIRMPDVGHVPQLESPDRFAEYMLDAHG
ncbi:MAG TPA: alpha/beta fold hydrolase [Polyangiaceae bacterium]